MIRKLAIAVMFLGAAGILVGGVFLGLGLLRNAEIIGAMKAEHVSLSNLGIKGDDAAKEIVSLGTAQKAADTIRQHRNSIAPSYRDLLGQGKFDATNPKHLTYAQAMNLENYLYLAVVALGLVQAVMGSGVFMVLAGIGLVVTGVALYQLHRKLAL